MTYLMRSKMDYFERFVDSVWDGWTYIPAINCITNRIHRKFAVSGSIHNDTIFPHQPEGGTVAESTPYLKSDGADLVSEIRVEGELWQQTGW